MTSSGPGYNKKFIEYVQIISELYMFASSNLCAHKEDAHLCLIQTDL